MEMGQIKRGMKGKWVQGKMRKRKIKYVYEWIIIQTDK